MILVLIKNLINIILFQAILVLRENYQFIWKLTIIKAGVQLAKKLLKYLSKNDNFWDGKNNKGETTLD